jgi:hypothetical protein
VIAPSRRFAGPRRGNLGVDELEDFDTPNGPGRSPSRTSSRRDLSTEAMIDGMASISHNRDQSGSTDTLPSSKPFDVHVATNPTTAMEGPDTHHGRPVIASPEEARVRGSNLHVSRIWGPTP